MPGNNNRTSNNTFLAYGYAGPEYFRATIYHKKRSAMFTIVFKGQHGIYKLFSLWLKRP